MRSGGGLRLGSIFGIEIHVDWSWLLILAFVTWNMGTVLGQTHQDWGLLLVWGLGFAAALLLFISVLAHELAHSLVAQARGIPVDDITLFLFGGVSDIEREPRVAGGEFLMAIVGPVTSLILGAGLMLLGGAIDHVRQTGINATQILTRLSPGVTLVLWLGSVNIALGIFNLLPAFPLDGGRVLRSILWGVSGDFSKATVWAAYVGEVIAWAMIIAGVLMAIGIRIPYLGSGIISGVWIALIGWFIHAGARRNLRRPGRRA